MQKCGNQGQQKPAPGTHPGSADSYVNLNIFGFGFKYDRNFRAGEKESWYKHAFTPFRLVCVCASFLNC